ncbi:hypothetical protein LCR01_14280 [Companilactobacillus crustorum]|uniref:Uncharacterized protein n=1 Tax=Companilactobacillus crustorum TaxID=392416 RepID=A0AB34AC16_9LACO|nr:hypothetical protein [Companilactobacillus crustorum]GEO76985.1 hypothetical protein LCR01_14280 [Companilactobacillus crustorum]
MTRIDRLQQKKKTERVDRNVGFIKVFIVISVIYFICQIVTTINL